jgi:hypothetical protein
MPTTHRLFLEVDDSVAALPRNAPANPIMAQPLYVAGITVPHPAKGSRATCSGADKGSPAEKENS